MVSILPKEETIIDPLYEPLKLNRYELCDHLTMLSNVSHLRYGFSPYLLFDVEGWKEVVGVIRGVKDDEQIDSISECEGLIKKCDNFIGNLEEYLTILKELPVVKNKRRNELYKNLKYGEDERDNGRDGIKKEYKEIKDGYQEILNKFLHNPNKFKENFGKIAHLFRLDYPVEVKCPKREKQFMCEEGKIYSMKEALLRTFELRRARWLQMSGSLHTVHRAATHTRLSHQIGSMIAGVNALREIDVYPRENVSMSLGEYLLMRGELHEFLMANFLHDIGHSPLSHVLEPNPFIELDHEKVTRNLVSGGVVKGEEGVDWYAIERYLLKMNAIKNFRHRFFENQYDPIYDVGEGYKWEDEEERRKEFLSYLGEEKNSEILKSEIVTVNEVLDNFGVNTRRVIEILSGKMFCPKCEKLSKIEIDETGTVKCEECRRDTEIEKEKFYDMQFLNKLVESEVDLDRMDHVKRDSVVCGLSLISFRLLELLGSMSVVLPGSDAYKEIHNMENKKPCILISEDGLLYVMDLLTARKSVFKDVLYSDENNWINGVVNQITALAVRYLPHLTNMLPFITDQVLMHFYTNDLFLGTQIDKLNKLFHGKMGYSGYEKLMQYKLKDGVIITKDDLREMYKKIEGINADSNRDRMEIPAVVFYTNIKETKCPVCKANKSEGLEVLYKKCSEEHIHAESVMKVINCKKCKGHGTEGEKEGEIVYPFGLEKDLFKLSECPICSGEIKKKDFQDFIECEKCGIKMRKWSEENWDPMLVYGKKFKKDGDEKYFKFNDLVGKHRNTLRERFPERPSELDVKNLFYGWVSDFAITDGNKTNGYKSKEEWRDEIKKEIGGVFAGDIHEHELEEEFEKRKIGEFEKRFVDLDVVEGVN